VRPTVNTRIRLPFPARLARGLRTLGIVLAACALPAMARGQDLPSLRSEQSPTFTADVAVAVDPDGTPGLSLTISLTYPDLQWVKLAEGYGARFEMVVVFQPAKGISQQGDAWQRQLRVDDFARTTSYGSSVVERRTFHVLPGRYRMRVRVRDLNAGVESEVAGTVEVPDYSKVPLALAELELGTLDAGGTFEPQPARTFGFDSDRLAGRLAIVDRRDGAWPRGYTLRYRVLDENGQELAHGERLVTLQHAGATAVVRPDSASWFVGSYTFSIELDDARSHWRTERTFEVEESGPPRGQEFRRMLEPLAYIAEPRELDDLSHAAEADQAAAWEAFWKRRDPTPETARNEALIEFLRRIRYAEQHFQHFGPGWRSDMGRIYIKFGPPDQIESRPATLQSPQVEIWYYNRPYRQFVFADREGFGRFVLIGPGEE
jgi:GWxTD domain-containing protein